MKRNSGLRLVITCKWQLFSAVGAPRLFPGLVIVLVQLTHFAIECKVLASDTGINFVILWLMASPTGPKWDRKILRMPTIVFTKSNLLYLLKNGLSLFILLEKLAMLAAKVKRGVGVNIPRARYSVFRY